MNYSHCIAFNLAQASTQVPPLGGPRFSGTGLTIRNSIDSGGSRLTGTGLSLRELSDSTSTNSSRLSRELRENFRLRNSGSQMSPTDLSEPQETPRALTSSSFSLASPSSMSTTSQETTINYWKKWNNLKTTKPNGAPKQWTQDVCEYT